MKQKLLESTRPDSEQERNRETAHPMSFAAIKEETRPEIAAQTILSEILRDPNRMLMQVISHLYPVTDHDFYSKVKISSVEIIASLIGPLKKSTSSEVSPTLQDRLSFCWKILRQSDIALWKLKKGTITQKISLEEARDAFHNLLPVPLQDPLLFEILRQLKIEPDAKYLYHYLFFKKAKRPTNLPKPLSSFNKPYNRQDLLRVIWWSIRSIKEQYVNVTPDEPVQIYFTYVIEKIVKDLQDWCGLTTNMVPDLAAEVEGQLNEWLAYSHLEHPISEDTPDGDIDAESQRDLARAFLTFNDLTTKLVIKDPPHDPQIEARVRQLEENIHQLVLENASLEAKLSQSITEGQSTTGDSQITPEQSSDQSFLKELRDFLKLIDSKYSFDTLNLIQSGEESPLTFRSFLAHFFYSLRKKGFGLYPQNDVFDLTYEISGLYECEGFEVPPGHTITVRVVKRGWALQTKSRIFPVKRARIIKEE